MLRNILIISVISVFAATACVKSPVETGNSAENSQKETSVNQSTSEDAVGKNIRTEPARNPNEKTFRGNLGDNKFQMKLTREGEKLSGTYSYDKVGKNLQLSGEIEKNGKFTLNETDDAGRKTGEWNGTWTDEKNSQGVTVEGDWNKPNDKEKLGFYAVEQIVEFTGEAKFAVKTIKEKDASKRSEIFAEYPEISGIDSASAEKFNTLIKKKVTELNDSYKKQIADFSAEDIKSLPDYADLSNNVGYDIVLANNDFVALIFSDYEYLGGAHGMTIYTTVNYDLKNNKELRLADIFEPNSNYLKTISEYSIADLKKRVGEMSDDDWISKGASADANNYQNWNLTKKGLMFTFEPYQVAAYAAGSQTVIIPYEKLKDILRKEGIVAQFTK